MKINHRQACHIIRYLISNKFLGDNLNFVLPDTLDTIGELFDEEIKEARIIVRYGMAGKLWSNDGRIYISGWSHNEIGEKRFNIQQIEIESANSNIAAIIELYRDITDEELIAKNEASDAKQE